MVPASQLTLVAQRPHNVDFVASFFVPICRLQLCPLPGGGSLSISQRQIYRCMPLRRVVYFPHLQRDRGQSIVNFLGDYHIELCCYSIRSRCRQGVAERNKLGGAGLNVRVHSYVRDAAP